MTGPAAARPGPAPPGGGRPRVVIVDDHGLFRSGVRSELGDRVEVVGEADDVGPAIALIARVLPDVVLLDVHLPGGGGQAVVSAIRPAHPHVRFLALSASDAPEDVIAVIRAGARGYVTKTISGNDLVDAVYRSLPTTPCSHHGWQGSCWTRSRPCPQMARPARGSTPSSTS